MPSEFLVQTVIELDAAMRLTQEETQEEDDKSIGHWVATRAEVQRRLRTAVVITLDEELIKCLLKAPSFVIQSDLLFFLVTAVKKDEKKRAAILELIFERTSFDIDGAMTDQFINLSHMEKSKHGYAPFFVGSANMLWQAYLYGQVHIARTLLKLGASPDALGPFTGQSILMWACEQNDTEFVELMLEFGADVNLKVTPMDFFLKDWLSGQKSLRLRADIEIPNPAGLSLEEFLRHDQERKLVKQGKAKVSVCAGGGTAIFYACQRGHYSIARLLIEKGANCMIPNMEHFFENEPGNRQPGLTPLDLLLLEVGKSSQPNREDCALVLKDMILNCKDFKLTSHLVQAVFLYAFTHPSGYPLLEGYLGLPVALNAAIEVHNDRCYETILDAAVTFCPRNKQDKQLALVVTCFFPGWSDVQIEKTALFVFTVLLFSTDPDFNLRISIYDPQGGKIGARRSYLEFTIRNQDKQKAVDEYLQSFDPLQYPRSFDSKPRSPLPRHLLFAKRAPLCVRRQQENSVVGSRSTLAA